MKTLILALSAVTFSATVQAALTVPAGNWNQIASGTTTVTAEKITGSTAATNSAYWNNATKDSGTNGGADTNGFCRNVGCFVTGLDTDPQDNPAAPLGTAPGKVPTGWNNAVWYGNTDGSAINDFYFNAYPVNPQPYMLTEIAGNQFGNWVGWYDQGYTTFAAGDRGKKWDVIFNGFDAKGTTSATFTPTSGNFGLWFLPNFSTADPTAGTYPNSAQIAAALNNTSGTQTSMYTESARNKGFANTADQYFALFAQSNAALGVLPETFLIGVEDENIRGGADRDTNDMIFSMTVVPEPGYYVLLSLGMLALVTVRLRMKRAA